MSDPQQKRPVVQMLLLGFLLIVFPLGSFLYLRAGFAYQLDSWDEMDPIGPVGELFAYERPDSTIDIVFFEPANATDSVGQSVEALHEALDDSPAVRFVSLGEGRSQLIREDAVQLAALPYALEEGAFAKTAEPFSAACESVPIRQRAYTVDVNGQVRRCYNLHEGADVSRLVEQVALILPRGKEEDVILERKTEL